VPRPRLFDGTPDWVIEGALALETVRTTSARSAPLYREAGVREIWMIDPRARTVAIDRLAGVGYAEMIVSSGRIFSSVLEGFFVEAEWLWQPQLPDLMTCLQLLLGPRS
jgi:Uma2 family endonuclease